LLGTGPACALAIGVSGSLIGHVFGRPYRNGRSERPTHDLRAINGRSWSGDFILPH
jgi:hypothetical protein